MVCICVYKVKIMEDEKKTFTGMKENHIEGRNAVLEAFRSGRTIDKLYVLDGCQMHRSDPLPERQESTIQSSIM